MEKNYNKLVRDNIPEIIERSGNKCEFEILSDDDYIKMLDAKLDEELAEYHSDQNLEELADLLEVIYAVTKARGFSLDELESLRKEKAEKRGGFERKLLNLYFVITILQKIFLFALTVCQKYATMWHMPLWWNR